MTGSSVTVAPDRSLNVRWTIFRSVFGRTEPTSSGSSRIIASNAPSRPEVGALLPVRMEFAAENATSQASNVSKVDLLRSNRAVAQPGAE
jgi:hypothetical protein